MEMGSRDGESATGEGKWTVDACASAEEEEEEGGCGGGGLPIASSSAACSPSAPAVASIARFFFVVVVVSSSKLCSITSAIAWTTSADATRGMGATMPVRQASPRDTGRLTKSRPAHERTPLGGRDAFA